MVLINEFSRQHSSTEIFETVGVSKISQFDECTSVHERNFMSTVPGQENVEKILIGSRKQTYSDADSGTEEIELQMEQMALTNSNENEDQASIGSCEPNHDEGFSENEPIEEDSLAAIIKNDLLLAQTIPDELKKDLCASTKEAFHGEFARLIAFPLSLHHQVRYYLFAEEELYGASCPDLSSGYLQVDNAKGQFQCPNPLCRHVWTSMRARVSFFITPGQIGFIVLKIFGQNCQRCCSYTQALWYIDEVCRVMKNMARTFYAINYPDMIEHVNLEYKTVVPSERKTVRTSRHDPHQRSGKMMAQHVKEFCEACQRGLCFS